MSPCSLLKLKLQFKRAYSFFLQCAIITDERNIIRQLTSRDKLINFDFLSVTWLIFSLNVKATYCSETWVNVQQTTCRYIPEDNNPWKLLENIRNKCSKYRHKNNYSLRLPPCNWLTKEVIANFIACFRNIVIDEGLSLSDKMRAWH